MASHREQLDEFGVPVPAVEGLIAEQVRKEVGSFVQNAQAISRLEQDPFWKANAQEVVGFVEQQPAIKATFERIVDTDPAGAYDYIGLKYREAQRGAQPMPQPTPTTTPSGHPMGDSTAMLDMNGRPRAPQAPQVPPSSGFAHLDTGPRGGPAPATQAPSPEQLRTLWERAQSGTKQDVERYAHARLRTVVTDAHLNA